MNDFHHECQIHFYMYAFMYVDPEKIPEEEYLPAIKTYVENYKKYQLLEQSQKNIGLDLVTFVHNIMS